MMRALHLRAREAANNLHRAERELILLIQQIEECQGYLDLKYPSLFVYLVRGLGLSEAGTYHMIRVARRATRVPRFHLAVVNGEITVSKAKVIAGIITADNAEEWIEHARTLTARELERKVAESSPEGPRVEKTRYRSKDNIELTVSLTSETMELLKRAQEVISQKHQLPVNLAGVLHELADAYLERNDPIRKAERASQKESTRNEAEPSETRERQEAILRDEGECQYVLEDGNICGGRLFVDLHHIQPRAAGGSNLASNLITLCKAHHRLVHEQRSGYH